MKYVYASRSGNVEELVHVLGLEAMKIKDGTETMDQDFILFTYTDGRGVVPPVVTAFLKENHSYLKGVIVSGNMQRHGTPRIPPASTALKTSSINCNFTVEPQTFTTDLNIHLRSL